MEEILLLVQILGETFSFAPDVEETLYLIWVKHYILYQIWEKLCNVYKFVVSKAKYNNKMMPSSELYRKETIQNFF